MAVYDVEVNPVPAVLRAICARLRDRADLEGVYISRHDFENTHHLEQLLLISGDDQQQAVILGNMRVRHTIAVKGEIRVAVVGSGEEIADAAMDRAFAIEREMQREFRGKDAGHTLVAPDGRPQVIGVQMRRHDWTSGYHTDGTKRAFMIQFELEVTADTRRTV